MVVVRWWASRLGRFAKLPVAQRQEIVEIGCTTVPPPHDVVHGAVVEPHIASRHRTAAVHRPECSSLGAARQTRGAAEIDHSRCVQHHTVAHDVDRERAVGRVPCSGILAGGDDPY